ncbi:hypothetical protein AB205_0000860 [Aquarana catesbeiana]|uniref:Uncharacterized protein n=1 Tax=Aquarana catesbeiana TaxID=8400 RepID=A0A2G9QGD0_AQUCT|nr:hypothetical protein AB205_0000860 [Aquarana catesbeiana]
MSQAKRFHAVLQLVCVGDRSHTRADILVAEGRQDACTVLSPSEEETRMVGRDNVCISDTIPVVFLLEQTLCGIMDRALEAEQREVEEDFLSSQGPLYADTILAMPHNTQEESRRRRRILAVLEALKQRKTYLKLNRWFSISRTLGSSTWLRGGSSRYCNLVTLRSLILMPPQTVQCMGSLIVQNLLKDPPWPLLQGESL